MTSASNLARVAPRKRRDLESPVQRAILEYVWAAYPQVFTYSVPNGGFLLDSRIVAKLKWQGLRPGMPDLGLLWASNQLAFAEIKSEKGVLSDDQKSVHADLTAMGIRVAVWRSSFDADRSFVEWGVKSRERAA